MKLIAAPFTPFTHQSDLNPSIVAPMAGWLKTQGVDGVFVNGTTGETACLTMSERLQMSQAWVEAGKESGLEIMVHVGDNALGNACELASQAAAQGADALGVMAPYFFKPSDVGSLVGWVETIAQQAPQCPMYYYHIPGMTGVDVSMESFLEVALPRIPNLRGVKYSQVNPMDMLACLQRWGEQIEIYYGSDETMIHALLLGAHGAIGSSYNFAAPLYRRLIQAFQEGELSLARRLQYTSSRMVSHLSEKGYLSASKQLMRVHGWDLGPTRPPLTPLEPSVGDAVNQAIEKMLSEAC